MKWEKIDEDDYTGTDGGYTVRIEKMDDKWWSWLLLVNGVWREGGLSISLRAAKCKAKKWIRWHKAGFYS